MSKEQLKENVFYSTKLLVFGWFLLINSPIVIVLLWHDPRIFVIFIPLVFIIVPIADLYLFLAAKNYIKITSDKFIWRSALGQLREIELSNVKNLYWSDRGPDGVIIFNLETKDGGTYQLPNLLSSRAQEIISLLKEKKGIEGKIQRSNFLREIIMVVTVCGFFIVILYILKWVYNF